MCAALWLCAQHMACHFTSAISLSLLCLEASLLFAWQLADE
jgi:hypothetical protein